MMGTGAKCKKAVFLDRDGTINKDNGYVYQIEEFEILPGVIEGLHLLQDAGYLLIVVTNQSGIARGYYTEQDFRILTGWMMERFKTMGIQIAEVYYCPHLPNAPIPMYRKTCRCRKPGTGLYERAVKEFHIDLSKSYAIGDKIRDCSICEKTDCRGFLTGTKEESKVIEAVREGKYRHVQYEEDLYACALRICEEGER
jgi:D-glycero-D-manno-heptose 1,7-bisphosphate phosphatase